MMIAVDLERRRLVATPSSSFSFSVAAVSFNYLPLFFFSGSSSIEGIFDLLSGFTFGVSIAIFSATSTLGGRPRRFGISLLIEEVSNPLPSSLFASPFEFPSTFAFGISSSFAFPFEVGFDSFRGVGGSAVVIFLGLGTSREGEL